MAGIKSFRYLFFMMFWTMAWLFAPLLLVRLFVEGPMSNVWLVLALVFVWFAFPKINAWLILNSATFRVIWEWARENEETP